MLGSYFHAKTIINAVGANESIESLIVSLYAWYNESPLIL